MDVATAPTFRTRALIARLPCSASAMPSEANTSAAASGMPASSAATHVHVLGREDHQELRLERYDRGGRGQGAEPDHRVPEPGGRPVPLLALRPGAAASG